MLLLWYNLAKAEEENIKEAGTKPPSQTKKEAGTKPPSQTKEGLEFEFFLKFQSFYFA